ncbi:MAG: bile acid:sodium symporter family protein [Kiritimatiellae bacterium]|nr:bile acid:sodium symporter family protein [Kiritimatiellia bacterium]
MRMFIERLTNLFWLWTVLGVGWAWWRPTDFTWFLPYIAPGLAVIMLGMGLTLTVREFREVARRPVVVGSGVFAQYLIMPLCGWLIARLSNLPAGLAAGLVLVACCPGGTASNVITHLARGDTCLSVLMTMCSTLLAVVMTPLLTGWLAGQYVPVDRAALIRDTAMVVLLPVAAGITINQMSGRYLGVVKRISPLISVVGIVLIVGAIAGAQRRVILESGVRLVGAVVALHGLGFSLGYALARAWGYPVMWRRTISIEVGMQNSGLGSALARNLPHPAAAAPAAISAFCHCVIGAALAAWWRLRPAPPLAQDGRQPATGGGPAPGKEST